MGRGFGLGEGYIPVKPPIRPHFINTGVHMFDTLSERAEFALKVAASNEAFAFDTETSGLDWKRVHPVGYVFTLNENQSVYIPIRHGGGGNLAGCPPLETSEGPFVIHPFEVALNKAFQERERTYGNSAGPTIGHNLKFDAHLALNAGITLPKKMYCTQYGAAILDEHAKSHNLEFSCEVRQLPTKKSEMMHNHISRTFGIPNNREVMGHFWRLAGNDPIAREYAEGDGISTLALWRDQLPRLEEEGLTAISNLENALIRHIVKMERVGVKIDMERLGELEDIFKKKLQEAMSLLPDGFNSKAPTQVKAYLESNGIKDWPKTSLGNASFPEKWLELSEPGRKIVAGRQIRTVMNQFIEPMKNSHVYKGRVHTSLNQLRGDGFGVISGRFSSSFPNLQQVPKHNHELSALYRSIFVADQGYEFWEADYSQCEPRLFAHYAKAQVLIDGYNKTPPTDMHDVTAKMMDADRETVAKRMNMGLLTGMWPKTLAAHMGWDIPKAKNMWNQWFQVYPEIRTFQDSATHAMGTRGYVRTILGRRCRLDNPKFAYQATSRIIQGSNADILKMKLLQACEMIEQMGDAVQMLLTVHDSLEWQAEESERGRGFSREIVKACSEVQTEPFFLRVPFKMDVKKGRTWAEATFGKKIIFA